ncbi:integrating conjugative element protein [Vibrio pectenicida]|nr:integrating conjugative element protein [Vibrio pectenicida]
MKMCQRTLTPLLLTLTTVSTVNYAGNLGHRSDVLDYAVGGGPVISLPAREEHLKTVSLGLGWEVNLQCGLLNPQLTVKNQLNGITEGYQQMMGSVIESATGAVAALPGYLIQKEEPGLYDMLTNGVLQGKFDFDNGLTSCESFTEEMGELTSNNAYYDMAKAELWSGEVKKGDAVAAKKNVLSDMGNNGIAWLGGSRAGGRGQPPINPVEDGAKMGFVLLTEGQSEDKDHPVGLYRFWHSPEELGEWVAQVVGSQTIQTGTDQSQTRSTAGIGLSPDVADLSQIRLDELLDAVSRNQGSAHFPAPLVEALNEQKASNYQLTRIASELALAHAIEKALLARRALLTGQQEVYIAQNQPAKEDITKAVSLLEKEIDVLRYEAQARQSISSLSATQTMRRYDKTRSHQLPEAQEASSVFLTPQPSHASSQ